MTTESESELPIEVCLRGVADEIFVKLNEGGFYDRVLSLEFRNMILPPYLKDSTVRSSTLAVAELQFKVKYDYRHDTETITFLLFYDSINHHTQGVQKVSGELPCDLQNFMFNYVIPIPTNGLYGLGYLRSVKPISLSSFPGIAAVHRRTDQHFEDDLRERNYFMWNVKSKDLARIEVPSNSSGKSETICESNEPRNSYCQVLDTLLDEHYNPESRLSNLPIEIIERVYSHVVQFWKDHIETRGVFASVVAKVPFPSPKGINVNMMPIILSSRDSIPDNMKQYLPLLAACPINREEFGEIGYLTIHESIIEEDGTSQRRGGVHTETPGKIWLESYQDPSLEDVGGNWSIQVDAPLTVGWGRGLYDDALETHYEYIGGLYMASNVSDSCRVWNCKVINPEEIVGRLGDLEHMASYLGEGETLQGGEMVWMTDCTPHESLPLKKGTYRQYFRLVTSQVSVWYADHSTPNPLGITPPDHVTILHGNKFGLTEEQYPPIQVSPDQSNGGIGAKVKKTYKVLKEKLIGGSNDS